MFEDYSHCTLCPRNCGVDRHTATGRCHMPAALYLARAALHMWEEPCISGTRGSGAVFFSGCSLGCIYCQNRAISRGEAGKAVSPKRLADIFLELQAKGAHNINLVTPTHYLPHILLALPEARKNGLRIPVVYNTSGYEKPEILEKLSGLVDIFLPDFKYSSHVLAQRYSYAADYPDVVRAAIAKMAAMTGAPRFDGNGLLTSGTVVRILLLPGALIDAKNTVRYLSQTYGDRIILSLMRQYTPGVADPASPLSRTVTDAEYISLVRYARDKGVTLAYTQEKESAADSFIPPFDLTGV